MGRSSTTKFNNLSRGTSGSRGRSGPAQRQRPRNQRFTDEGTVDMAIDEGEISQEHEAEVPATEEDYRISGFRKKIKRREK